MTRITVPIDFSPHSGAALRWAEFWQARTGAVVTVLHCRPFEAPPAFTLEQVDDLAAQAVQSEVQVRDEVAAFVEAQVGHAVDWTIHVAEGDPVPAIREVSADADLIIMGTHGRHGLQRWMLGSVAEAMVHAATRPVLVVHGGQRPPRLARVQVAWHRASRDATALRAATEIAAGFGAEVTAVHVREPHDAPDGTPADVRLIEREGKPAETLLSTAAELDADLLVLASSPKPFLDLTIVPPTIVQVLQFGAVPALVLPPAVKGDS
jgi:nucleotide-binding universal stress UspA family protein